MKVLDKKTKIPIYVTIPVYEVDGNLEIKEEGIEAARCSFHLVRTQDIEEDRVNINRLAIIVNINGKKILKPVIMVATEC
jgi:hypothetical protein